MESIIIFGILVLVWWFAAKTKEVFTPAPGTRPIPGFSDVPDGKYPFRQDNEYFEKGAWIVIGMKIEAGAQ